MEPIWPMLWHMPREVAAIQERVVKLFQNGRNQAVRIPREFELPGKEALMRKDGDRIILEPVQPKSLLSILEQLEPLAEEFPPISDPPPDTVNI